VVDERNKIIVKKDGDRWYADRPALPGSPVVGRGDTHMEAIGVLFYQDQAKLGFEITVKDEGEENDD